MDPVFEVVQDAMALTGESPLWDPVRNTLWWIDIQGQRLLGHGETGDIRIPLPQMPGLVALAADGDLVVGLEDGLWLLSPQTRRIRRLAEVEADDGRTRLNDGKPDPDGRLWFGTMDKTGQGGRFGSFYRRDAGGRIVTIRHPVSVPNAIVAAPDGRTLYFADTPTQEILAFPLDRGTGELGKPAVFARYGAAERPDGACVDAEGGLWVAVVGGWRIDRFYPDGSLDRSFSLPVSRPTMPMFGGRDLDRLFVTSQRRFLDGDELLRQPAAGALLSARVGFTGLPANRLVI